MENSETEMEDSAAVADQEARAIAAPPAGEEEKEAGASSSCQDPVYLPNDEDFIFKKILGEGSFSTVYLAKNIHNDKEFAVKVCHKRQIMREKKIDNILRERRILYYLNERPKHSVPYFVKLFCSFHDPERLFFVLSYADNGNLLQFLTKLETFPTNCVQFYTAQILHAIEYLHSINIMHRDLKPENILLDANLHILLTDFGSANFIKDKEGGNDKRLEGTAHYVPPELLIGKVVDKSCDLWALGCITFQMVCGTPPFKGRSEYVIYRRIMELDYEFSESFEPSTKDFVVSMLRKIPDNRLGFGDKNGYPSIKLHPFFEGIDFDSIYSEMSPLMCLKENVESDDDVDQYENLEPGLDAKQQARLNGLDARFN